MKTPGCIVVRVDGSTNSLDASVGAELPVIGKGSQSGCSEMLSGSFREHITHAACPVLVRCRASHASPGASE